MCVTHIHSFLVHPAKKAEDPPKIGGTRIREGDLYDMLVEIYEDSQSECNVEIAFEQNTDGQQQNDMRDLILDYVGNPTVPKGRKIANKLQAVTTKVSGLGLLFLIRGELDDGDTNSVVLSRFPADKGVLAEQTDEDLNVEFIEKVFMKSSKSYKAALYEGAGDPDFWTGHAVDKQINNNVVSLSEYWIRDFLMSDLRSTARGGTRRLAIALKAACNSSESLAVKEEITAASKLSGGLVGRSVSMKSFCQRMALSEDAKGAVKEAAGHERLFTQQFRFNRDEFDKHLKIKSVELDNGAMMMAQADSFEEVFERVEIDQTSQTYRYSTEGQIKNQRLK